ncbi:RecB family exonuclease [Glycomyces sp. NPDC048151]|uniref:RecB family exonuclease n=1 Tax=Glycomyces sp. NPDC048151 TaxID=3364002 RepID=UPI00371A6760
MTILEQQKADAPPHTEEPHRSPSQLGDYARCPHMYWLKRIQLVPQRPDAWSPEGKAIHRAIESFELSRRQITLEEVQQTFTDAYDWEIDLLCEREPDPARWADSGPRYPAEVDIKRRRERGQHILASYLAFAEAHPDQAPIVLDSRIAVELKLEFRLGGVPILCYVDQIVEIPAAKPGQRLRVRDVKNGQAPAAPHNQLGTYKLGVELVHGVKIDVGDYWYGKTGRLSKVKDLTEYTEAYLTDQYGQLDQDIKAGRFDPKPSPANCRSCSVSGSCAHWMLY